MQQWTACSWLLNKSDALSSWLEADRGHVQYTWKDALLALFAATSVSTMWLSLMYNTFNYCIFLKATFKCLKTHKAPEKCFCWHKILFCYKKKTVASFLIKLCPQEKKKMILRLRIFPILILLFFNLKWYLVFLQLLLEFLSCRVE